MSCHPRYAAAYSGNIPLLSVAPGAAPDFSSSCTQAVWWASAAAYKGVVPFVLALLGFAL